MQTIEVWYKGEPFTLERNVYGMWTTFALGVGFLRADTINGVMKLLKEVA